MSKNIFRTAAITLGGLALAAGAWTAVAAPRDTVPADTTISAAVASDLAFSRDEERMARDLYAAIAAQYDNAVPFSTITNSEQRHYDSVGVLLTRYGIPDPAAGKTAGVYANAEIQKLYDTLLAQSKTSLAEAYKVGVAVETRDIADVKDSMATATQADIDRVYGNLLNGSQMHLQSFTDATNGLVSTHVADGTRAGMNRTTAAGATNGPGTGTTTGVGNANRGGYGMNGTQGNGTYGNGLGGGTCVTE
ncbi:MAG: DUF2202 domain-containing protein [Propionibacteriaceae bacterium]